MDNWCPNCGGEGKLCTSRYGGNDPDVWPIGGCHECNGTGLRERYTPSRRRFRGSLPITPAGKIAHHLTVASQARLTLAGKLRVGGYWTMPAARSTVAAAWHFHMNSAHAAIRGEQP